MECRNQLLRQRQAQRGRWQQQAGEQASSRMPAALRAFLADVSLFVNHQLKTYCPVKRNQCNIVSYVLNTH
jgi:hypothetical protein